MSDKKERENGSFLYVSSLKKCHVSYLSYNTLHSLHYSRKNIDKVHLVEFDHVGQHVWLNRGCSFIKCEHQLIRRATQNENLQWTVVELRHF